MPEHGGPVHRLPVRTKRTMIRHLQEPHLQADGRHCASYDDRAMWAWSMEHLETRHRELHAGAEVTA
jgi:hypothetical protein